MCPDRRTAEVTAVAIGFGAATAHPSFDDAVVNNTKNMGYET